MATTKVKKKPTSASSWSSKTPTVDLELPSGNVARVRRVGPEVFLRQGILPDSVTALVEKNVRKKQGKRPLDASAILQDKEQIGQMLEMLDRVLVYSVIEPKVLMPPSCSVCGEDDVVSAKMHEDKDRPDFHVFQPNPRLEDALYADVVDLDDKLFIMNFCVGGTRDIERFRRELGESVGSLSSGEEAEGEAE